jgi:hypothetical protein
MTGEPAIPWRPAMRLILDNNIPYRFKDALASADGMLTISHAKDLGIGHLQSLPKCEAAKWYAIEA